MSDDRWLCGWRVASDLPLVDLMPWRGDDRAPDIVVRLGEVPARLADAVHEGPVLAVAADGTCRYQVAGIAAYLVEGGRRVIVRPEPEAAASDVTLLLLGSIFGILCHQRGLLPLHAGCVEIGGRAVAFAGHSGVGKSTLTAAFAQRGHPILSDDVTVVDIAAPDDPVVLPSFPRLKLWRDAIDGLGLSTEHLMRSRTGLEKFNVPRPAGFHYVPMPLAAIYVLETITDQRYAGIKPLRGLALVTTLFGVVYRRMMALHAGRQADLMSDIASLGRTPVFRLSRVHDLAALDATVDAIVAHAASRPKSGAA